MDERHWWIAGKIQDSFKLGSSDDTRLLEEFLSQETTISKVNSFFKAGGACRIFFYCVKPSLNAATREIHCTGNLASLNDLDLERITILYFLRKKADKNVDPSKMEKDIFCGELKHNTIETLNSLLVDIYIPLLRAQKDWGQCNEDGQRNLVLNMDKFVTALNESATSVSHSRQAVLQLPEKLVDKDFREQRVAAHDTQLIVQYEELICEWMNTIESILNDASDDCHLDPNAGPLSELEKWKRRQRLLTNVVGQLKGKECKAVLAVLIASKSKQLKRWRIMDASITDSLNDAKDKVRYMESLKLHFDLMGQNTDPAFIMKTALPGLINAIKQMDSISRFYARTGFLGVLLTKVTNQLVQACKDHIKQCTYNVVEDKDVLWDRVTEEISGYDPLRQGDPHHKIFNKMVESKLRESHFHNLLDLSSPDDTLCARLRTCLSLQTCYRESIQSLREALIKSQSHSRLSSISNFSVGNIAVKRDILTPGSKSSKHKQGIFVMNQGVPLADDSAILSHLSIFCRRVHQMLEVISTVAQFTKLRGSLVDIPRPRKEDLNAEGSSEQESNKHMKQKDVLTDMLDKEDDESSLIETTSKIPAIHGSPLPAINEDVEQVQTESAENSNTDLSYHPQASSYSSYSVDRLSEEEVSYLRKFYPEDAFADGPSISSIVEQHLATMNGALKDHVTTKTMLDVKSKEKAFFDSCYNKFQNVVHGLERFIGVYLHAIFMRKMKTQQGLEIITKFHSIINRSGVRGVITEKYVKVFEWYGSELDEVLKIYEKYKEHPLIVRNAPPVAGAIFWSRQLLRQIEEPMKIFRDNKAVTSLPDFGSQVRTYNRLATALVTFESLWFTQWKRSIEQARSGLKATVFAVHPETGEVVVNSDNKLLELVHEAKWMIRLEIQIPNSAISVLRQEERLKSYKGSLELVLKNFREVCQGIPGSLLKMFHPHIEPVHHQFLPGLSTLAWDNLNIDAFLHQIFAATEKLRVLIGRVNQVMDENVNAALTTVKDFCLFDTDGAIAHTWNVNEFQTWMMKSINERAAILKSYVSTFLSGLETVAEILTTRKPDCKQLMKEKKSQVMQNEEHQKDKQETHTESANALEFIECFKDQMYEAVLTSITKSLASLANACGCQGEVIRAFTPNFDSSSVSSRESSAHSRGNHSPMCGHSTSHMTNFLEVDWLSGRNVDLSACLQFEVSLRFSIPNITIEPTLDAVQKVITGVADSILQATKDISQVDHDFERTFNLISKDSNVQELHSQLSSIIDELRGDVNRYLFNFSYYNFLWKDDKNGNFSEFIMADPGEMVIKREAGRFVNLEKKVMEIPSRLSVGPISLFSDPIKDSLKSFSMTWKTMYASVLHEDAKKRLDSVVSYRTHVMMQLKQHVQTLDQLNAALHLLEELTDMEDKIDGLYLPIETMYSKLREFELKLPRIEVEEVDGLRASWSELMELADQVREELLKERKGAFEQELDKQIKAFVVEVIQFRNAFDAQGPAVLGIQPADAVARLYDFQYLYSIYDAKRKTLNSVSKLFSIVCKSFPELDKTGEELELLSQLYGLFQKLIHFESKLRDTLWAEVDLKCSAQEIESYWDECLALPSKLKGWDAYNDLNEKLQTYLEVFPLLQKLSSKEIRNRHWLQVMQVSHSSFQLEGNIFKLCHLLDIGLTKYKIEVEEICQRASRELELESKMRITEEEWTEQVLNFEHYKKRGPIFLDKAFTERLLEQLDDAGTLLATMLTSRYIGPLRDEAASWAQKLKEVADILELWLEVQDLWQYLEAVFSNSLALKDLPQEAKRFSRIDKAWTKMMKRAFDTRNVLQCCYGDEVSKAVVLHHIHEELEVCFRSLGEYLNNKRQAFPRFYFVSDSVLLALLSRPDDLESVRPHLRSIFSAIADVKLENTSSSPASSSGIGGVQRPAGLINSQADKSNSSSVVPVLAHTTIPAKIDKHLHQHYNTSSSGLLDASTMLPSEGLVNDVTIVDATAVISADGEMLGLSERVTLNEGVEIWLRKLKDSVGKTLQALNQSVIADCQKGVGFEEWALKYPSQVCRTGMLYHWSAECEAAITEIKHEKKSLHGALRKFNLATGRLVAVLQKGLGRNSDDLTLTMQCLRLEAMISQATYLKDILENICQRKLRETTDFEWRRSVRCYLQPATIDDEESVAVAEVKLVPHIWILDSHYEYGQEFNGADTGAPASPATERCFLAMSLALRQMKGALLMGTPESGRIETIKGLASILGNFVAIFQVSREHDPSSIGKITQGLTMDGSWGCFDHIQILSKHCLSVLLDFAHSIFLALRAKQSSMTLLDGTEIPLCKTVGLFLSANMPNVTNQRLSSDITESFRTISLIKPDIGHVLKAKCSSMGFRAPVVLANRLKLLAQLVKDQLPPEIHHSFSIQTLIGALKSAMLNKRRSKEDKMADKSGLKEEASRSDSQSSETQINRSKYSAVNVTTNKVSHAIIASKSAASITLTAQGKQDHLLICEAIEEIIGPRLTAENHALFKTILKSCFHNLPKSEVLTRKSPEKERNTSSANVLSSKTHPSVSYFESALVSKAVESKLVPHKPWIAKCVQLFTLSQVHNGIIVAGPPGSGKSSCIKNVVDAFGMQPQENSQKSSAGKSSSECIHKLLHMNPLVVDDTALMFGSLSQRNEWVDGIFTHSVRKANRNHSTTWLCLDGVLNESWTDNLNIVLTGDKVLHLKSGDKLFLSERFKLLFETDNLNHSSPSTVSSCGILYVDRDVVGWKPISKAWLDTRSHLEVHVLQKAFQKTLDPITNFVLNEARPYLKHSDVGMLKSCLGLLAAMLADNIAVSGELHIERLYLFCLMWTFGGLLDTSGQKTFSDLLKTLSTALPDDDRDICAFDYFVDECGEWDPWHSRLSETVHVDSQDIHGEVYVDTIDTVRTRILMEFSAASGRNVLLAGPHGSGKTAMIDSFLGRQDSQLSVCKRLVFSGASTATNVQHFVESNIHHRQGFVYGAAENKKLKIFIDDINRPQADQDGTQRCNELLRQLLDVKQLCTLRKPFEWHTVEDLSVLAAMTVSDYPALPNKSLKERLMCHFSVFWLPAPQDEALRSIVHGILEVNMKAAGGQDLDLELHNALVSVSCRMLTAIQNVLPPSPTDGRHHYLFTLKDITKCFQCLQRLTSQNRTDQDMVISLWQHELKRTVRDRITRTSDLNWFDEKQGSVITEMWGLKSDLHEHFVTFGLDAHVFQRPIPSLYPKVVKVTLQPVKNMEELHGCLYAHLNRYIEDLGRTNLSIILSEYIISHIVRVHRVLSFHHGGNVLLVGALGSHLSTLCQLALYVADIPIHKVDTSKQSSFFDGLRSAIRMSGSEGKVVSMLFTSRDLLDPSYLDAINSLLLCGEYPYLFSNDEIDDLLQPIIPTMKKEFPGSSMDAMTFFISRVKSNLHILICLQPSHDLLKTSGSCYPGLLKGCQLNWMCDWPQETLLSEASYFIARHQLTEDFGHLRENIITSLANIHSFVMRDCRQLCWAGDVSAEVTMVSNTYLDKKKDQCKVETAIMPNLPYSKVILQERIKLNHRNACPKAKNEVYVGPITYRRFMESFRHLYSQKAKDRTRSVERLKKVIETLDKTRADAKIMKKGIRTATSKFDAAQKVTADLLKRLTAKVTAMEKIKAKVGLSVSLDAYLQLNELDDEEEDEDELLKEEKYDEYDAQFDKMREASLKNRGVHAQEELVHVQTQVGDCRASLAYAREQAMLWRSKVDRNVIERVRAFQNPPVLVGQVIEMVLVMIGKRLPPQRANEAKESYASKEDMSTSSGSSKLALKKAKIKETSDRFDKTQWKGMQQPMADSVKFVDMLHNISWEDGLPTDVLAAVEGYLACSKDGQLGVTGEGSLLENAQDKKFQAIKQRSNTTGGRGGLTIAGVKYASEDCATLVNYTIAIVEYSRLCGPLRLALERMHELEREIEKNEEHQMQQELENQAGEEELKQEEEKEELSETSLPRIQQEIDQLQAEFDDAVVEKHSLEVELLSMDERLKAALEMVDSLKGQESKWRVEVKDNDCNELLLANCITAAGVLTYCGPVSIDIRRRLGELFIQVCEQHGLPVHKNQLFRNVELVDFLYSKLDVIRLQQLHLPTSPLMLENACFLVQDVSMTAWPLVCDPTSRFIDWLKFLYSGKQLVEVKYHEIRSQLDNCLSDGTALLVTDCDVSRLMNDQRFTHTIQNCASFINGKSRFKVKVSDHEVECDPGFRLFLHTTSEPHMCPHELAVYTAVTFFQQSRAAVEEELLNVFMTQEKTRLDNEQINLKKEQQENLETLEKLEKEMINELSGEIRLMSSLQTTKKLIELKKRFDEALESQAQVQANEDSILKARDGFRAVAQRAAVCFDTAQYMRDVNPLYHTSFKHFVSIYQAAIAHSERFSTKTVIDRLTLNSFLTAARGYLERDRLIYALLLAIEVEDSLGNVGVGEREFVISPNFSSVVMSHVTASPSADLHIAQSKKPFDWMTDDQFHNLQVLATHFEWFKDMFDHLSKDGKETLWRTLCESEFPENLPLPDKMDDTLKAIQRLCILRAVRSDRLLQASSAFIGQVLGKKYITDISLDLPTVFKQSSPTLPIMFLFGTEADLTVKMFQDFCSKKQSRCVTIMLTNGNVADNKAVKKQIKEGMIQGTWILLHNAHNSPQLLDSVGSILNEGRPQSDPNFRLWISCHFMSSTIPIQLLQNSIKVCVDTPKIMRDSLARSFSWMEPDILRQSSRPEWPAMLHNLCFLHAAIHLRTCFGSAGWNLPHEFSSIGFSELQESVGFSVEEFKDLLLVTAADGSQVARTTSLTGLRYMLSEIVYGSYITDNYDQQSLSAMVDLWCGTNATKKDFEVARLKYKIPAAFFNPNVRLNSLAQVFDGLPQFSLETPEACNLHPSTETLLGEDQYIFTRLNRILDAMPSSSTLSHRLFPRPLTPSSNPPTAGVSSQSSNPLVVDQGVFSSASYTLYKMSKGVELWDTCHTLLQKIPKTFSKDYIAEKVKKVGGLTAFNCFIMREMELMYRLLSEIKTSLQAIKTAAENTALGDHIPQHILDVADDIYHLQIPRSWCEMCGNAAPPQSFGLGQWLVELQNRCHHFERILTLGREKMPAYWLGAFFKPRGLLAQLKQDSVRNYSNDRSGNFDVFTFQTEVTSRDKDHLRDPPQEGMFIWGIYIWGCAWDRTTGEILDLPPRSSCAALPVVHVTCWPAAEKPIMQDSAHVSEIYQCPVYHSRQARTEVLLELDLRKEGVPAARWALRGLSATIRPH